MYSVVESLGSTDALRRTSRLPGRYKKPTSGVARVQVHVMHIRARLVVTTPVRCIAALETIATNLPREWSAVPYYSYFQCLLF